MPFLLYFVTVVVVVAVAISDVAVVVTVVAVVVLFQKVELELDWIVVVLKEVFDFLAQCIHSAIAHISPDRAFQTTWQYMATTKTLSESTTPYTKRSQYNIPNIGP